MRLPVSNRNAVLSSLFPGRDVSVIEGEFVTDEDPDVLVSSLIPGDEVELPGHMMNGLMNKGPTALREIIATEEGERVEWSKALLDRMSGSNIECGEPYRGEEPNVQRVGSLRELIGEISENIFPDRVALVSGGIPMDIETEDGVRECSFIGVFDFDYLMDQIAEHGYPEGN